MQITVMTLNKSLYGLRLLNLLWRNHIRVEQVVVFSGTWQRNLNLLRNAAKRIGWRVALTYAAKRLTSQRASRKNIWRGQPFEWDYRQLANRVDYAVSPRSPETLHALESSRPDLCLLGQSGIVPVAVLAIPRLVTLNAHPGILPDYRGVDVCFWAIYENKFDKVGSTLHIVDAGIDTGRILKIRPFKWAGDETVDNLEGRIYEDCLDLLVEACCAEWPAYLDQAVAQSGGKYYYLMPPNLLSEADRNLKSFLSRRDTS